MPIDDQQNQERQASERGDKSRQAFGTVEQRAKFTADESSVKGIDKALDGLDKRIKAVTSKFRELVKVSKDLKGVWKDLDAPSMGGAGGTSGRTSAGGISWNGDYLGKSGKAYGGARAAGMSARVGLAAGAAVAGFQVGRAAWDYAGGRIEANTPYSLTADRTGLMMRQMYGGTQLDYQSRWRQPLLGGLIGRGGVEEMLKLQTTMGINPSSMLSGVEGIRVASGFGYSTQQATQMITALAQPGSSNMMTMMLGMGLYGPGGKARDPMDVVRNAVQRFGLTDPKMVEGAFQPGSMTRANLSRAGVPTDMIDFVLQYAQENVQFQGLGGQGMYDPSSESHRRMMGVDESFAMEEQRTRMSEAERSEKFYRRQVDNFAQLERNTQGLIEKFQMLDEVLSGVIGTRANLQNKWWLRLAGTLIPGIGDSEQLRDAGMNSGFASQLQKMKNAADEEGVPLTLSSGTRDLATQERIFTQRHVEDPNGAVNWDGKTWTLKAGMAQVNPPGQSLHNLGYAADLGPTDSYDWIVANASRFGLRHGASFGEPWHVAPANITNVSQVPGYQAESTSTTGTSAFTGIRSSSNSKRQQLGRPDVHLTTGMSMPMALKTWTEYGRSRTAFEMEGLGDTEGYGGGSVTISPTFNITGSGGAADADLLAKRVILLIETSEAVRALRRS